MRNIAANLLTILVVASILLLTAIELGKRAFEAAGPLEEEVAIVLPRGSGLEATSRLLKQHGAIDSERLFRLGARYRGAARDIRYGEYLIPAHASMDEILALLVSGKSILHKLTVPEGKTSYEIVEIMNANEVLTGEIAEVPPEGSLAPSTYHVQRNDSREKWLKIMEEEQDEILAQAWESRAADLPLQSPEEALILASIVEKETGVASERGLVASVYINRLRRGMLLQSDPTVVYGLTEGKAPLGRGLRRSELDRATPYNTYKVSGLPPTPIAAPGREAIMAVVNPEVTNFLYFVADGSGGHVFAKTLAEHNRNVAAWRKIERERAQPQ